MNKDGSLSLEQTMALLNGEDIETIAVKDAKAAVTEQPSVLSQNEIDNMLQESSPATALSGSRPKKYKREQIGAIHNLHQRFASMAAKRLSALLNCPVSMETVSITDDLTMDEFLRSIPAPSTLGVISVEPLKGSALFEIDPSITFAMIQKLTGKEKPIMESVYTCLLENLREAWSGVTTDLSRVSGGINRTGTTFPITDLRPQLDKIETSPEFIKIVPPADGVILITFEAKIENEQGMLNLGYPFSVIEPLRLFATFWGKSEENSLWKQPSFYPYRRPLPVSPLRGTSFLNAIPA
jgi:flagellar motor switch protein FliM